MDPRRYALRLHRYGYRSATWQFVFGLGVVIALGEFFLHEDDHGWFRVVGFVAMVIGLSAIATIRMWNQYSDSRNEPGSIGEFKRSHRYSSGLAPSQRHYERDLWHLDVKDNGEVVVKRTVRKKAPTAPLLGLNFFGASLSPREQRRMRFDVEVAGFSGGGELDHYADWIQDDEVVVWVKLPRTTPVEFSVSFEWPYAFQRLAKGKGKEKATVTPTVRTDKLKVTLLLPASVGRAKYVPIRLPAAAIKPVRSGTRHGLEWEIENPPLNKPLGVEFQASDNQR